MLSTIHHMNTSIVKAFDGVLTFLELIIFNADGQLSEEFIILLIPVELFVTLNFTDQKSSLKFFIDQSSGYEMK